MCADVMLLACCWYFVADQHLFAACLPMCFWALPQPTTVCVEVCSAGLLTNTYFCTAYRPPLLCLAAYNKQDMHGKMLVLLLTNLCLRPACQCAFVPSFSLQQAGHVRQEVGRPSVTDQHFPVHCLSTPPFCALQPTTSRTRTARAGQTPRSLTHHSHSVDASRCVCARILLIGLRCALVVCCAAFVTVLLLIGLCCALVAYSSAA